MNFENHPGEMHDEQDGQAAHYRKKCAAAPKPHTSTDPSLAFDTEHKNKPLPPIPRGAWVPPSSYPAIHGNSKPKLPRAAPKDRVANYTPEPRRVKPSTITTTGNVRVMPRNADGRFVEASIRVANPTKYVGLAGLDPMTAQASASAGASQPAPIQAARPQRSGSVFATNHADNNSRPGSRRGSLVDAVKSLGRRLSNASIHAAASTKQATVKAAKSTKKASISAAESTKKASIIAAEATKYAAAVAAEPLNNAIDIVKMGPTERDKFILKKDDMKRGSHSLKLEQQRRAYPQDRPSYQKAAIVRKLSGEHDLNIPKDVVHEQYNDYITHVATGGLHNDSLDLSKGERELARGNADKFGRMQETNARIHAPVAPDLLTGLEKGAFKIAAVVDTIKNRGRSNTVDSDLSFGMTDSVPDDCRDLIEKCSACGEVPTIGYIKNGLCTANCYGYVARERLNKMYDRECEPFLRKV